MVTGLGHVYLRRYLAGVLLFALFASALDGVLVGAAWQGPEAPIIALVSKIAAVTVWVLGMASVLKLTVFTDRARLRRLRDEKMREGLMSHLRGDDEAALRALEAARACDVDRTDSDVLFHLGVAAARCGLYPLARRSFRRCLAMDPARKWRREIDQETARMGAAKPARREAIEVPTTPSPAGERTCGAEGVTRAGALNP